MTELTPDDTLNTVESLLTDADNALAEAKELLLQQCPWQGVPGQWEVPEEIKNLNEDIIMAGASTRAALYSWKAAYRQVSTQ